MTIYSVLLKGKAWGTEEGGGGEGGKGIDEAVHLGISGEWVYGVLSGEEGGEK